MAYASSSAVPVGSALSGLAAAEACYHLRCRPRCELAGTRYLGTETAPSAVDANRLPLSAVPMLDANRVSSDPQVAGVVRGCAIVFRPVPPSVIPNATSAREIGVQSRAQTARRRVDRNFEARWVRYVAGQWRFRSLLLLVQTPT